MKGGIKKLTPTWEGYLPYLEPAIVILDTLQ